QWGNNSVIASGWSASCFTLAPTLAAKSISASSLKALLTTFDAGTFSIGSNPTDLIADRRIRVRQCKFSQCSHRRPHSRQGPVHDGLPQIQRCSLVRRQTGG